MKQKCFQQLCVVYFETKQNPAKIFRPAVMEIRQVDAALQLTVTSEGDEPKLR